MTAAEIKQQINNLLADNTTGDISAADMRTVLNNMTDMVGATQVDNSIPEWAAGLTFQTDGTNDGEYCRYADTSGNIRLWITKIDNNTGNIPPTDPAITENTYWKEVSASSSTPIQEWAAGIYGDGLVIVFHNDRLYKLNDPTRPFNSSNIITEIAAGQWIGLSSDVKNIAHSTSIPFDNLRTVMADHAITAKNTYTVDNTNQVTQGSCQLRLTANGNAAHIPDFSAFNRVVGQKGWNNKNGALNTVTFYYDGTNYWYKIDSPQSLGAFSGSMIFNSSGDYDDLTLTGNITITASDIEADCFRVVKIIGNGAYTVSLGAGMLLVNGETGAIVGDNWFYFMSVNGVVQTVVLDKPRLATPIISVLVGNASLSLTWNAIIGADGYTLLRNTVNNQATAVAVSGYGGTETSFIDTGLTNNIQYFYWVIASDSSNTYRDSFAAWTSGTPVSLSSYSVTANKTGLVTSPSGIAVDNTNQKVYVLEQNGGVLRKIDIASWTEDANIDLGITGAQLAIDEAGQLLYATTVTTDLHVIDLSTFTEVSGSPFTMSNSHQMVGVDIDVAGNKIYLGDIESGNIRIEVYNLTTKAYIKTIDNASVLNTFGLMLNTDKTFMYVCDTLATTVWKVDLSDDSFTTFVDAADGINSSDRGIVVDQFNNRILVTKGQETTNQVLVFDFAGTLVDSFTVPGSTTNQLRQIAFNSARNEYYLCNRDQDEITVFKGS